MYGGGYGNRPRKTVRGGSLSLGATGRTQIPRCSNKKKVRADEGGEDLDGALTGILGLGAIDNQKTERGRAYLG